MTIWQYKQIGRALRYVLNAEDRVYTARNIYAIARFIKPIYTKNGNRRLTWEMLCTEANIVGFYE
jgi:hypothetical protein